jgi:hypothetical protein
MSTVSAVIAVFAVIYFFDPLFAPKMSTQNRKNRENRTPVLRPAGTAPQQPRQKSY